MPSTFSENQAEIIDAPFRDLHIGFRLASPVETECTPECAAEKTDIAHFQHLAFQKPNSHLCPFRLLKLF